MSASTEFQPNQILYLQHQTTRVYAELIQIVPERQLGWVRPLALVECDRLDWQQADFRSDLHDLRQGSDLLCPLSLFQMALDVEVVPILMALETMALETFKQQPEDTADLTSGIDRTAHQRLQNFVRDLWQTQPQVFQP
jgi:hypothetical protein